MKANGGFINENCFNRQPQQRKNNYVQCPNRQKRNGWKLGGGYR